MGSINSSNSGASCSVEGVMKSYQRRAIGLSYAGAVLTIRRCLHRGSGLDPLLQSWVVEQGIHQPYAAQLIDKGHVALRGLNGPLKGAGIARPAASILPGQLGPEQLPAAIATA